MYTATISSLVLAGLIGLTSALPAPNPQGGCSDPVNDGPRTVFIARGGSKGNGMIGTAVFDQTAKTFEVVTSNEVDFVPSWLLINGQTLYAVNEWASGIRAFSIGAGNSLTPAQDVEGALGLVSLEMNGDKTQVFGAGFGSGTVNVFDVDASTGELSNSREIVSDGVIGPNEERQDKPRVHQVLRDPSGDFIAVTDLGTDEILVIGRAADDFGVVSRVGSSPGCGPRHGVFFPVGGDKATHFFLLCELLNTVETFTVTYEGDVMTLNKTGEPVSTYAPDGEFAVQNATTAKAAEIQISSDSAHVYISNRLSGNPTDNIAHFSIVAGAEDGSQVSLRLVDHISTGGLEPRMFSLSSDSSIAFVGNQAGEKGAVAFSRDAATGSLTELGGFVPQSEINPDLAEQPRDGLQFILEAPSA